MLQATLPDALVALQSLEQLDLQDNKLSGSLPAWAGNLTWGQVTHVDPAASNVFLGCTPHDCPAARSRLVSTCARFRWCHH